DRPRRHVFEIVRSMVGRSGKDIGHAEPMSPRTVRLLRPRPNYFCARRSECEEHHRQSATLRLYARWLLELELVSSLPTENFHAAAPLDPDDGRPSLDPVVAYLAACPDPDRGDLPAGKALHARSPAEIG